MQTDLPPAGRCALWEDRMGDAVRLFEALERPEADARLRGESCLSETLLSAAPRGDTPEHGGASNPAIRFAW